MAGRLQTDKTLDFASYKRTKMGKETFTNAKLCGIHDKAPPFFKEKYHHAPSLVSLLQEKPRKPRSERHPLQSGYWKMAWEKLSEILFKKTSRVSRKTFPFSVR